ncbi:MerR family transcriptional regulator [Rathayibacter iranicus]|uniref:MerR family transcriptional regulator n=2 Tax=Rathayibacter iranicus TaxID=59737 RepID=A0AAD1EL32_9MICO|nr:MerR family transcriptional regulator [Rathayibacter iranicus]AZZ54646.1 MerR family transcriptional regulator [Rathayibacter iranicus]MWV30433.1 MerR family transcriptional regulator [Rathayibacter iranicus NCPPB 2253 = VKM Ac-1602]PPI51085.1 MerR family transcriptional regulator [Rathayibacter iranicus]PPI63425.1 MerR family transcriptional regulator [Rathayibacter iranicus]PPI74135.1 MerR family transcriptional regulator [Rathayibacter iranicus]
MPTATAAPTETEVLSISQVAAVTGLTVHTLRYYERAGLMLDPVERAASQHRRYRPADVGWVDFLTKLRATGMPIARIREYARLLRIGPATEPERLALLRTHRDEVEAQLARTHASLTAIDIKIAAYQERTTTL